MTTYYENIGSPAYPVFERNENQNPFGLRNVQEWGQARIDFVDIDSDGDLDAFRGGSEVRGREEIWDTVRVQSNAALYFYENKSERVIPESGSIIDASVNGGLAPISENTLNITINVANEDDPTSITGNISGSTLEDESAAGTINAIDADGLNGPSIFSIESIGLPAHGSASINAKTGLWEYNPNPDFNGVDSFTVTVSDDKGGTTNQVISINIEKADDPAKITGDIKAQTIEDQEITGVLEATDAEGLDGDSIFSIETGNKPNHGTATIDAKSGHGNMYLKPTSMALIYLLLPLRMTKEENKPIS